MISEFFICGIDLLHKNFYSLTDSITDSLIVKDENKIKLKVFTDHLWIELQLFTKQLLQQDILISPMMIRVLQYYSDVIMSAMASQIAGISIVCSAFCSGADQRKHQSSVSLAFVRGIHRWLASQRGSNEEKVSIWWRHHEMVGILANV